MTIAARSFCPGDYPPRLPTICRPLPNLPTSRSAHQCASKWGVYNLLRWSKNIQKQGYLPNLMGKIWEIVIKHDKPSNVEAAQIQTNPKPRWPCHLAASRAIFRRAHSSDQASCSFPAAQLRKATSSKACFSNKNEPTNDSTNTSYIHGRLNAINHPQ